MQLNSLRGIRPSIRHILIRISILWSLRNGWFTGKRWMAVSMREWSECCRIWIMKILCWRISVKNGYKVLNSLSPRLLIPFILKYNITKIKINSKITNKESLWRISLKCLKMCSLFLRMNLFHSFLSKNRSIYCPWLIAYIKYWKATIPI